MPDPSRPFTARLHTAIEGLDAAAWNALLEHQAAPTPFMRHEYLQALEASGSATTETGWTPCHLSLHEGERLVAACPLYWKAHSYGEYVFDWAWADAYRRHGLAYYPKLVCAVPFTPVPGTRLLAADETCRHALVSAIGEVARQQGASSAHLLFCDGTDVDATIRAGWMERDAVQFHWHNRPEGFDHFSDFLASLQRDKRKKIQQERRRVAEAGVHFTSHEGTAITPELWSLFYRCYTRTYREHGSTPYLTRDFFHRMARDLAAHWLLFVAWRGEQPVATSLLAVDRARSVVFGRYWGALQRVPMLHFEACYYQPIEWCIANRMQRLEGGAQGEHKLARGLMPTRQRSAHWLAHPQFARAVADFLQQEGAGMDAYLDELNERSPFKAS